MVQIFWFWKGLRTSKRLWMLLGCWPFILLLALYPWVFEDFLIFALDCPFGFSPKSHVFYFHSFSLFLFVELSHHALENSKFVPNRWMIYQDDFGWRIKTTTLLTMKNSLRKILFSLSIHIRSKWTFQVRNVGQGSWFQKK